MFDHGDRVPKEHLGVVWNECLGAAEYSDMWTFCSRK